MLVCGGVSSEDFVFVDIVGVCSTSAGMVWRETEDIKIGCCRDDRVGCIVVLVCWFGEDGFNKFSGDAYWMVGFAVQTAAKKLQNVG